MNQRTALLLATLSLLGDVAQASFFKFGAGKRGKRLAEQELMDTKQALATKDQELTQLKESLEVKAIEVSSFDLLFHIDSRSGAGNSVTSCSKYPPATPEH